MTALQIFWLLVSCAIVGVMVTALVVAVLAAFAERSLRDLDPEDW